MDKKKGIPRLVIQAVSTALCNGYLKGFAHGKIYTGKLKYICVPGLNCYSCPGALGACPIGSLQAALTDRRFHGLLYVLGMLTVFGTLMGRLVCGFLCPFGFLQDLLFRIPFVKKLRKLPGERLLRYLRYGVLFLFVILLPMVVADVAGVGDPWFCKYICPAGTLEGGIPLVLMNRGLREAVGFLYTWKLTILAVTVILSCILARPFCRYLCPLGALYGLFNRVSFYRYKISDEACIRCGACQKACALDIPVWEKPNSADCIRCGKCRQACPTGAIRSMYERKAKNGQKRA